MDKELILKYVKENFDEVTQCGMMSLFLNYERYKEKEVTAVDYEVIQYKNNGTDIYSVKRLIDGEVFTVSDAVKYYNCLRTISEFKLHDTRMYVCGDGFGCFLENLQHIPVKPLPLLKTEEGINIKDGDNFWEVLIDDFVICPCQANEFTVPDYETVKYFFTPDAAKDYVIMNKRCLSINEIKSFNPDIEKQPSYFKEALLKAKEFVRKRNNL